MDGQRCSACPAICRKDDQRMNCCLWSWIVISSISALFLVVLLPLSFMDVEYNEWAFKKYRVNNDVNTDRVYSHGRYYTGSVHDAVTFPRNYKEASVGLDIFPSNGLEFRINLVFFYRVDKNNLDKIYKSFGTSFEKQVITRANSELKGIAPSFSLNEYITHRHEITQTFFNGDPSNPQKIGLSAELASINMVLP